jgi:hypothetical protein
VTWKQGCFSNCTLVSYRRQRHVYKTTDQASPSSIGRKNDSVLHPTAISLDFPHQTADIVLVVVNMCPGKPEEAKLLGKFPLLGSISVCNDAVG